MDYHKYSTIVRDMFDNVFAIHWKGSSLDHIKKLIVHLRKIGCRVQFYTPESALSENVDFNYIGRFFQGKEDNYPSIEIEIDGFILNCFLEYETSISLWFNDSSDTEITIERFKFIKSIMSDLASTFERPVYFVNEGESTHRYKIFKINSEAVETDYDLNDTSKYVEEIA